MLLFLEYWVRGGAADDLNLYTYVRNDPIDGIDPSGLAFEDYVNYGDPQTNQMNSNSSAEAARDVSLPVLSVAAGCAAGTCVPVLIGAGAGGGVAASFGVMNGHSGTQLLMDTAHGIESGAATATAGGLARGPAGLAGRLQTAGAVAVAANASTRAQGGSDAEANIAGLAAGAVELATGSLTAASAAASGAKKVFSVLGLSVGKKAASSAIKQETRKQQCAVPTGTRIPVCSS